MTCLEIFRDRLTEIHAIPISTVILDSSRNYSVRLGRGLSIHWVPVAEHRSRLPNLNKFSTNSLPERASSGFARAQLKFHSRCLANNGSRKVQLTRLHRTLCATTDAELANKEANSRVHGVNSDRMKMTARGREGMRG